MDFFRTQAGRHMTQAMAQERGGNMQKAHYHYLKAAEYLYKAARQVPAEEQERIVVQAEALLQRAQAVEKAGLAPPEAAAAGEAPAWLVAERPSIRFADVAGLDEVKEQIRLRLVYPFTHPEKARHYGIKQGGGLLLYGPPGTGKTMLARAVAGEIDAPFYTVKPSDIMSKWVGEAEQNIARLFQAARSTARAVIFIDEVESLMPRRRDSASTVMQRVVPQILTEMQGFEEHAGALLFVGATNEPWSLDTAALRPGRFDEKVYIPLPDLPARLRILELHTRKRPLDQDVDLEELAHLAEGYSGADLVHMCEKVADLAFLEAVQTGEDRPIAMADFLSAFQEVQPSVTAKDLARFEKFEQNA